MKTIAWKSFFLGKRLLLWMVYFLFACYIGTLCLTSTALGAKLFFGGFGLLALVIVALFEYLKFAYENMIATLTVTCDLAEAYRLRQAFEKKDVFNGFKHSLVIFDTLLLLDQENYSACLAHLAAHQSFFHGSLDYLFIYYHSQLYCYHFISDEANVQHVLTKLNQLYASSKNQTSGLFSWQEIKALRYYHQGRKTKSLATFELIDENKLNNRELAYLYLFKADCLFALNKKAEGYRMRKQFKKISAPSSDNCT